MNLGQWIAMNSATEVALEVPEFLATKKTTKCVLAYELGRMPPPPPPPEPSAQNTPIEGRFRRGSIGQIVYNILAKNPKEEFYPDDVLAKMEGKKCGLKRIRVALSDMVSRKIAVGLGPRDARRYKLRERASRGEGEKE